MVKNTNYRSTSSTWISTILICLLYILMFLSWYGNFLDFELMKDLAHKIIQDISHVHVYFYE